MYLKNMKYIIIILYTIVSYGCNSCMGSMSNSGSPGNESEG